MLNYTKIKDKPRIFQSFTGLTLLAFSHLLTAFGQAQEQAWQQREGRRSNPRQRRRGGGRKPTLVRLEDKWVFSLFYFRPEAQPQPSPSCRTNTYK